MRPRSAPKVLGLAASILLSAALAGCVPPGSAPPASAAAATPTGGTVSVAPPASVASSVASAMAEGSLGNEHCQKSPDGTWTYTARLTNHDTAREAFTVAIGLTRATAVLDHAMVERTLGPGESMDISATGFGKDVPSGGTDCGAAVSKERAE